MNDYNERNTWLRMRALLTNDPRWGRGGGNGEEPRANEPKRPENRGGDGPPDLDEMWRNFNRRLSGLFSRKGSGGGGGGFRPDNGRAARIGVGIVIGVLIAVYLGSGIFIVPEGQTGVVLRFGQYERSAGRGVHWRLPYPFASHQIVDTAQVRSIEVGRNGAVPFSNVKDTSMLTRDGEIVDVRLAVQYRIRSATDYLFHAADPELSVSQSARSAVRAIVGTHSAKDVLGMDRETLASELSVAIQRDLDRYRTGLAVTGVAVQAVALPEQVQQAANAVAKARDDGAARARAAQTYADELLPRARGDAAKTVDDAKAYAERVVGQAQGDADRFSQVYAQYSKAPAVIRERLYLETMQDIYANTTKVYVGNKGGSSVLYLPLDKLVEQARVRTQQPGAASSAPASGAPAAAPASAASAAAAASSASSASASAGTDPLRSREAFRNRVRENDLQ